MYGLLCLFQITYIDTEDFTFHVQPLSFYITSFTLNSPIRTFKMLPFTRQFSCVTFPFMELCGRHQMHISSCLIKHASIYLLID